MHIAGKPNPTNTLKPDATYVVLEAKVFLGPFVQVHVAEIYAKGRAREVEGWFNLTPHFAESLDA